MLIIPTKKLVASRNGDFPWAPPYLRGPEGGPFTAIDLTNYVGRIQFRIAPGGGGDPLLDLGTLIDPTDAGSALTFPDPKSDGVISLFIAKADWSAFPVTAPLTEPDTYWWDLLLTNPGNITERYVTGTLVLSPGVTRT